jgi:WbqC-like protein family
VRDALEIRTPMVRSSELPVEGQRSGLLLDICRKAGANAFLGGMGGSRDYLDKEAFAAVGMGVEWQDFHSPQYPQCGTGPFLPGLSALDLLFNCGPRSREIVWQSAVGRDALLAA